jgi:competence protein ComEC
MQFVSRAFVPALSAFLVGVGVAAFLTASFLVVGLCFLVTAICFVLTLFHNKRNVLLLVGVCALLVGFGMLRFIFWAETPNDPTLASALGQSVVLRGVVSDEPDVRETNTQLTIAVNGVLDGNTVSAADGKVLLITSRYPEYQYGDAIEVNGVLKKPESFSSDDGRVFDYPNYLKAKGIAYQMFHPEITMIGPNEGNIVRAKLFAMKHAFLEQLSRVLPEPENALAGGILLGGKRSLGTEWTERFRETGIIHIVVLSGYNMTIVAEWLGATFLFLGFYGSLLVSALGIISFACMTGAGATVLRAAIMALLVLLARLTGRTETMGRALLVAGVVMVLHDPAILALDPSFQLSFLAALGLVFVAPLLKTHLRIFRTSPLVEEVIISTIATQIMVLPLLLYQTGILSLIALPANLLVLPLIPLTMLFAFATGLVAFVSTTLAFLPALPTGVSLSWILAVGKYGAALPFAAVHLPPLSGWLVAAAYAVLAGLIYRLRCPGVEAALPRPPA